MSSAGSSQTTTLSKNLLMKQLKDLNKNPVAGFSAGLTDESDPYKWDITMFGPNDTPYEGGFFRGEMQFPQTYPCDPPTLKIFDFWHPNVFADGSVCISILHAPGEDVTGYESASERWLPVHTVESILLSVISMIADPNVDSPANIDAAKLYREDRATFKKKAQRCAQRSQENM